MNAHILSVNISGLELMSWNGMTMTTGIGKRPVEGRVMIRKHQLDGDKQGDLVHHGGEFKAAYSYAREHYDYWYDTLERNDWHYGIFGENLTTEGLNEDSLCLGDQLRFGEALLEVAQPRHPCRTLALRFQDMEIVKKFMDSWCYGVYYRVLEEGSVGAGDSIEIVYRHPAKVAITELTRLYVHDKDDRAGLEKILALDTLPPEWQEKFGKQLAAL